MAKNAHAKCGVFGCTNKTPPLFIIPNPKKYLERFQQWLQALSNPRFTGMPYDRIHRSRPLVCHKHFTKDSYRFDGVKLLPTAVPTLNLPNTDAGLSGSHITNLSTASFQHVQIDLPQLEDNSNLHLVEGHEILQSLSSLNAKDIDIPKTKQPYVFPGRFFQHYRDYFLHELEDTSEATNPSKVDNTCTESESLNVIELELPSVFEDLQAIESSELVQKPYFKSIKSYMLDSKKVTEVCRICFRSLDDEEVIKLYDQPNATQIKNMLKLVLPDLDLNIYPQNVICTKCSELLSHSYKLKETWLRTEEKLQKIIDKRKSVTNRDADLVIAVNKNVEDKAEQNLNDGKKSTPNEISSFYGELNSDTSIEPKSISRNGKKIKKAEDKAEQNLNDGERSTTSKENMILKNILSPTPSNEISLFHRELNSDESVKPKSVSVSRYGKKCNLWGGGPYICELCGRLYQSVPSIQRHLRCHQNLPNDKENERKRNQRMCEICGQLCFSLKSHLRIHREHRCTICNKQYKWHAQLVTHMNIVHFKAGRSFQCHLCGKRYFYKTSLKLHLQTHKPKNHLLCNICDKRFSLPSSLRKHLVTHVQEKQWTCNYCGRTLKHEVNLHKHIEIFHKNKGRYICDICNKPFWKKITLEKHKYRIHRIVGSRTEQFFE